MSEESGKPLSNSRREFLKGASVAPAALYLDGCAAGGQKTGTATSSGTPGSMSNYPHAPLDTVRVGIIGMGRRGLPQ
jgi:hypothetical protein